MLYQRPGAESLLPDRCLRCGDGPSGTSSSLPDLPQVPALQMAGPALKTAGPSIASAAIGRLKLERSAPSGNLSKLYNMKVRAFAPAGPGAEGDS